LGASRAQISVATGERGTRWRGAVQQRLAQTRRRALIWLLASAVAALGTDEAWPAPNHRHAPNHLKHAQVHRSKTAEARHYRRASNHSKRYARLRQSKRRYVARTIARSVSSPVVRPAVSLPPDLAVVKQALELVRQRRPREATALAMSINDPVGQKLVEWASLRHAESEARFERYATFIRANPDWPSIPLLRQRAEVKLQEPRYRAPARGFLGGEPTGSADGPSLEHQTRGTQERDQRWRERRGLARRLIDLGDAASAYRVVRAAAPPGNPYYRAEYHFMAGWIALRFLNDSSTALEHFARIDEGSTDPIVRARAAYWRGRAAEVAGRFEEMRAQYEAAARYPTAYYGQLANARLGLGEIAFRSPQPEPSSGTARELAHAAEILYSIGERDLALSFHDRPRQGEQRRCLCRCGRSGHAAP
jgi:tetratricopeptide (TPR) repeat protein